MGEFGPWHWLIVAAVFVVVFGSKKLPDAARSLGKSARILKTELRGLHEDDQDAAKPAQITAAAPEVSSTETVAASDQSPGS